MDDSCNLISKYNHQLFIYIFIYHELFSLLRLFFLLDHSFPVPWLKRLLPGWKLRGSGERLSPQNRGGRWWAGNGCCGAPRSSPRHLSRSCRSFTPPSLAAVSAADVGSALSCGAVVSQL